jgi:hypothetical protein
MVKILALLALLAGTARADSADSTSVDRFGYRIGIGSLPIDGKETFMFSLGLGIEHPLFGHFRALAEYELVFTETHDDPARMPPPEYGTGHRLHVGLRHVLVDKDVGVLRLWVDGEVGGGLGLFSDNVTAARSFPDAFAGLRIGYDLHAHRSSPARTFVAELLVRMIVIDRGAGVMGGVGMYWGN